MPQPRSIHISFASKHAKLREALSAVVCIGNTLWAANDETTSLERFIAEAGDGNDTPQYSTHQHIPLSDYLHLPIPPEGDEEGEEVDLEGLAYADGYLWLTGSHSLSRSKPDADDPPEKALRKLAELRRSGNRFLLARIPVTLDQHGICNLHANIQENDTTRTAACLQNGISSNELTAALRSDPHLQAFLDLPSKENGLDIEGLAATGQRVFLGLRGPVLRGYACILELQPQTATHMPSLLRLASIGSSGQPYRKHFLKLAGLGVRDLCVHHDDLLILAGPTMSAEGPIRLYRWHGGANPKEENVVDGKALRLLLELPTSEDDHAEGICLYPPDSNEPELLVVYDPAARSRLPDKKTVIADLFPLEN